MDNDFVAYAKHPAIHIRSWADLQPYTVACASGWKIYDTTLRPLDAR